jgi:pimeloyl-ACP methyl ester carboxylesterase
VSGETFLQAAGQRLEVRWTRPPSPDRTALVFLHEGLGSVAQWRDFPDVVSERTGAAALVYSRRGYGASDPVPAAPRDVRFMHDEAYVVLPALLDAAGLKSVVLVGHSDGASIALLHAAKEGPSRVRGVVAIAPHLFVEDVTVKSIAAITETWHRTPDLRSRLARYHGANVDGAFLGWSGVWLDPRFRSWNIEREVSELSVPLLVVQGADDEYGTLAQVEACRRAVTRGGPEQVETRVLAQCGHSPHRDQPEELARAIEGFVRRVRIDPGDSP